MRRSRASSVAGGAAPRTAGRSGRSSDAAGGRVNGTQDHHSRRQGSRARSACRTTIFGLEPRTDLIQRCVDWQLAKRQRRHAQGARTAPRSGAPARRCTSRRAPAAPVTAPRASPCSAAAAARSVRSCAAMRIDLPKKVRALALRACAVGQGEGRRHHRARQGCSRRTPRPRRCAAQFGKLGLDNALIIDGAEVDDELRASPRATFRTSTCCRCRASTSTTSCGARSWC